MPDAGKNMDDLFNLCASFPEDTEKKAFFDAARNNNIPALEKIIDKWPDAPNKWYDDGKPVLLKHYDTIKPETLAFLLGKGADINQTDTKGNWTPLIMAGFLGTEKDVEKFIRAGAPVDHEDKAGRTALAMAVDQGKCLPAIDMLVICGADPQHHGSWRNKTIMQEAKTDEIRDILLNAQARREAFLKGEKLQPKPAAPAAPYTPPAEDSDEIKLLKRIELRKAGDDPAPKKTGDAAGKKPWWKLGS